MQLSEAREVVDFSSFYYWCYDNGDSDGSNVNCNYIHERLAYLLQRKKLILILVFISFCG